jgi:hypothetical protein
MKATRYLTLLLALAVAASLLAPAGAVAQKKKKKKAPAGPVVVGTDDAGDWGCNQDCSLSPFGDAAGMDLVKATIEMADKETVNFIIGLNSLPSKRGVPELVRYTWNFSVDAEHFQMSGGFTEYVRGICNPTTPNTCPPPRDPGSSPFFLRQGSCLVGTDPDCEEVALLHATFDAAKSEIVVPIPLEVLKGKPGSKIVPGAASFGGTIYAAPGLFVTQESLPWDGLQATKTFTVPKK